MLMPRSVAFSMLHYCDQLEAELKLGDTDRVVTMARQLFQSWLDEADETDLNIAIRAMRALAQEVIRNKEVV